MRRDEIVDLVEELVQHGRWGELTPARRRAIEETWCEALYPYDPDTVLHVVKLAIEDNRLDRLTPGKIARECHLIAKRRWYVSLTPGVECMACAELGAGGLCDYHRETGKAHIRALRERFGWNEPALAP